MLQKTSNSREQRIAVISCVCRCKLILQMFYKNKASNSRATLPTHRERNRQTLKKGWIEWIRTSRRQLAPKFGRISISANSSIFRTTFRGSNIWRICRNGDSSKFRGELPTTDPNSSPTPSLYIYWNEWVQNNLPARYCEENCIDFEKKSCNKYLSVWKYCDDTNVDRRVKRQRKTCGQR